MRMFKKEEGFTLVELMVVVLIIGILVAVAIPVFNAASDSAREKTCIANLRTLDGALQQYKADDQAVPADYAAAVVALTPYVKEWPDCPHPDNAAPTYTFSNANEEFACEYVGHSYLP